MLNPLSGTLPSSFPHDLLMWLSNPIRKWGMFLAVVSFADTAPLYFILSSNLRYICLRLTSIRITSGCMSTHHTHCIICLMEFHTKERLLNHLRYRSYLCYINTMHRGTKISRETADRIDHDCRLYYRDLGKSGKKRSLAVDPSIRIQGPLVLPSIAPLEHSQHHVLGRGRHY